MVRGCGGSGPMGQVLPPDDCPSVLPTWCWEEEAGGRNRGGTSTCEHDAIVVRTFLLSSGLTQVKCGVCDQHKASHLTRIGWWPPRSSLCQVRTLTKAHRSRLPGVGAGFGDTGQQAESRGIKTVIGMKEDINAAVITGQCPDWNEGRSHYCTLGQWVKVVPQENPPTT